MTAGPAFFNLPREIRDKIYKTLLVLGYPIFIFQDSPSSPIESFTPDRPLQWLSPLLVNHQVHDEARKVLYGTNRFTLVDTALEEVHLLRSFLDTIGPTNASLLSHLSINFPALEQLQQSQLGKGKTALTQEGRKSVTLLRDRCSSLTSLEMLVHTKSSRGLVVAGDDDLLSVQEALLPIDTLLQPISSLRKIIIRFHTELPAPAIISAIQGLGWVAYHGERALQNVEVKERAS